MRYSEIIESNDFQFRYDYVKEELQFVSEATDAEKATADICNWLNTPALRKVEDGYVIINSTPLSKDKFADKDALNDAIKELTDIRNIADKEDDSWEMSR